MRYDSCLCAEVENRRRVGDDPQITQIGDAGVLGARGTHRVVISRQGLSKENENRRVSRATDPG